MMWSRLKDMRCPKDDCGADLQSQGLLDINYVCSKQCGFIISSGRFNEIAKNWYRPKYAPGFDPEENLSELNNLEV